MLTIGYGGAETAQTLMGEILTCVMAIYSMIFFSTAIIGIVKLLKFTKRQMWLWELY